MDKPQCFQCGGACEQRLAPSRVYKMKYDGSAHQVLVDNMPEWYCAACDVSVVDEESDQYLQAALRKHIGLLSPEQIKAGIKALKISQDRFAERIGCAAESVSRWLNGAVVQSRAYDRLMRIYFHCPEVRGLLANFTPENTFGNEVLQFEAVESGRSAAGDLRRKLATAESESIWARALISALARHVDSRPFSPLGTASTVASPEGRKDVSALEDIKLRWQVLTQSDWDRGGESQITSASRIPAWAWTGVGGEAA